MNDVESRSQSFLKPLSDKEFEYISALVYSYSGINLHEGKRELVRARLCKRLRELDIDSFSQYCDYLQQNQDPREMNRLLDTLSTNLTSFFREQKHFDFLQNQLPTILKNKLANGHRRFRIWSTACSSGEEPYSLAILLADALEQFPRIDAKILATDISTNMVQIAETGVYSIAKVKTVAPHWKVKYFSFDSNGHYVVKDMLKHLITFRLLNVVGEWPFRGPLDIIFCRNMMIYFDKPTQLALVRRFENQLSPGGYLFVGHSESLIGVPHGMKYVEPTIYQKRV